MPSSYRLQPHREAPQPVQMLQKLLEAVVQRPAVVAGVAQGQDHPESEQLQGLAFGLLEECAEERGITAEQFEGWWTSQRLNDPGHVFPAVEQALVELVGNANWLFDRAAVLQNL